MNTRGSIQPIDDPIRHLTQQIKSLTLVEQVRLLQCLADTIGQQVGVPPPLASLVSQASGLTQQEQPAAATTQPDATGSIILDALTYRIIGCAQAVHRRLGKGLREESYQRALETEFVEAGLACRPQQKLAVYDNYRQENGGLGQFLGYYIPDFAIEDQVIVEIKALTRTDDSHIAQVIAYLAVSGCRVGLLINFGERSLRPRRILPPADLQHHPISTQWLWNPNPAQR